MLSWVRLDEQTFKSTVNELESILQMGVINSVKEIDYNQVLDGYGIDLQHAV